MTVKADPTSQAPLPVAVSATRPRRHALASGQGRAGLALVGLVVLLGALAPALAPFGATEQLPGAQLLAPNAQHWLGTDVVGRDVLSRVLHGIRVDLVIVFVAVPAGAVVGALCGLLSTVWRPLDVFLQRTFDLILAFPLLILAIAVTALAGPGVLTVCVVIVLAEIPVFGRLIRTSVLTVRELPYVEAPTVVGASRWWVLRRHVLPNSMAPVTVQLALSMSVAVFVEGAMSFLGLGVAPPTPSLGALVKDGAAHLYVAPYLVVGPLLVITVLVLGLLLVAQAMNRASRQD